MAGCRYEWGPGAGVENSVGRVLRVGSGLVRNSAGVYDMAIARLFSHLCFSPLPPLAARLLALLPAGGMALPQLTAP